MITDIASKWPQYAWQITEQHILISGGTTTTTVLRPLYRSTCVTWHHLLRTGGFCWCKVLLPACPCWRRPVHLDCIAITKTLGEDAVVLLNSVICTVSVPWWKQAKIHYSSWCTSTHHAVIIKSNQQQCWLCNWSLNMYRGNRHLISQSAFLTWVHSFTVTIT